MDGGEVVVVVVEEEGERERATARGTNLRVSAAWAETKASRGEQRRLIEQV
jgi:hypothetical protein